MHIFLAIEREIIPKIFEIAKSRKVTIWSSACSSGQEPYTIAMMLDSYAEDSSQEYLLPKISIKATDLDSDILTKAKIGKYNSFEITRGLPKDYIEKYFIINNDNSYEIIDKIKDRISFSRINLTSTAFYPTFVDFILCRNVLIYFDEETKKEIISSLYNVLNDNGYLILGSSESLYNINNDFKRLEIGNAIMYKK